MSNVIMYMYRGICSNWKKNFPLCLLGTPRARHANNGVSWYISCRKTENTWANLFHLQNVIWFFSLSYRIVQKILPNYQNWTKTGNIFSQIIYSKNTLERAILKEALSAPIKSFWLFDLVVSFIYPQGVPLVWNNFLWKICERKMETPWKVVFYFF